MKANKIIAVALTAFTLASCGEQKLDPAKAEAQLKVMNQKVVNQEVKIPIDVTMHTNIRLAGTTEQGGKKMNATSEIRFFPTKSYIYSKATIETPTGAKETTESYLYYKDNQFVAAAAIGEKKFYTAVEAATSEESFGKDSDVMEHAKQIGEMIGEAYVSFQGLFDDLRDNGGVIASLEGLGAKVELSSAFETKGEGHLKGSYNLTATLKEAEIAHQEALIELDNYVPVQIKALSTVGGKEIAFVDNNLSWGVGDIVYPDLSTWTKQ